MLQGIVNISTNVEHNEVKKDYKLYGKNRSYLSSESSNDLIQVSPAFKFLSKLNWKIQNINASDKERITVVFSLENLTFKITINLNLLPAINKIYIEAKKNFDRKSLALVFSVPFQFTITENFENISLTNLEVLFSRLDFFARNRDNDSSDNKVSYGLYEDLMPGLKSEFQKILYAFVVFIEKLTSQKISDKVQGINNNSNFENIRLENVEVR